MFSHIFKGAPYGNKNAAGTRGAGGSGDGKSGAASVLSAMKA